MKKICLALTSALMLCSISAHAGKLAGIELPGQVQVGGENLSLNGAGIRSKFVFDIYVVGLYLPAAQSDAKTLLASPPASRVTMHFVYDKVEKEKLDDAWREGFEDNLDSDALAALESRLVTFTALFGDAVENDVFMLDYHPGTGTRVTINGAEKGVVEGADFNAALLSIWIGDDPISRKLKSQLLGKK